MCVVQVAPATLWSCFPLSASGADMLLFSLLHTGSEGGCCCCCSAETDHGLLRFCRNPPASSTSAATYFLLPFLLLSLSVIVPLAISLCPLPFLTIFSFPCHLALLPFGHATVPPPFNQGILDAQRKGRGRGSGRSRPPRRNLRKTAEGRSSVSPPQLLITSLSSPKEAAVTRLHPPLYFFYPLVCIKFCFSDSLNCIYPNTAILNC